MNSYELARARCIDTLMSMGLVKTTDMFRDPIPHPEPSSALACAALRLLRGSDGGLTLCQWEHLADLLSAVDEHTGQLAADDYVSIVWGG